MGMEITQCIDDLGAMRKQIMIMNLTYNYSQCLASPYVTARPFIDTAYSYALLSSVHPILS